MKIGVISDVHGFMDGLERALDFLQRQEVDHILCAGDLVDRGPDGDAVVDRIRKENIPCVQGNHDYTAAMTQAYLKRTPKLAELIGVLRDDTVHFLKSLPKSQRFNWEGTSILLAHATPWDNDTYVYAVSPEDLHRRVVEAARTDIIILGHTHQPMRTKVGDSWILNPGSVGISYGESTHTCGILLLPERVFTLYDLETEQMIVPFGTTY